MKENPIIDTMATIASPPIAYELSSRFAEFGPIVVDTEFIKRALFRHPDTGGDPAFHLHLRAAVHNESVRVGSPSSINWDE
ncbi:hypothetical protein J1G33_20395 [Pseudomonas sp. P867]|nr:hypothetical protein [Pseudomonas sp. P867]